MKLYAQRSDGAYVSFEGMTQEQIATMLAAQGLTATFITADQYAAATQKQNGAT